MPTPTLTLDAREHNFTEDDQAIAITSVVLRGRTLWCGLTGGRHCLVPFDVDTGGFGQAVDIFPWADDTPQMVLRKIHNALNLLDDGRLAIGEGILFGWDGIPFEMGRLTDNDLMAKRRAAAGAPPLSPQRVAPTDLASFDMRWMAGGRLLTYAPETGESDVIGKVARFNYVQSMIVNPVTHQGFGHTLGDCHFFVADFNARSVEDHGKISNFAFHNLCIAPDGVLWGAWTDRDQRGKLRVLRYDPAKGYLERLPQAFLDDPGPRVQGNVGIDAWLVHSSGAMYFGIAGTGVLYRFDPETFAVQEIGLIGEGGRVTTLDEDDRGRIIYTAGFPLMHVGRYDPSSGRIEDFGPVSDRYERIYFHGSAYVDDRLYLADTDSGIATLWEVALPT